MADPPFRRDLYRDTARYYDAYRMPYPPELAADLTSRIGAGGNGRLLDLACGTGQVAFLMAPYFSTVLAVDQEPDMVALGSRKAQTLDTPHVRFVQGSAEMLDLGPDRFDLVSVGNAFHRLPRDEVAERMRDWLLPGGHVALLWSHNPWAGDEPWQEALHAVVQGWQTQLGGDERVPTGWARTRAERPDAVVLQDHGLSCVGRYTFPILHSFAVESLVGFAYSTSVFSPAVVGDEGPAFEQDVATAVLPFAQEGLVTATIRFAYELFRCS